MTDDTVPDLVQAIDANIDNGDDYDTAYDKAIAALANQDDT